MRRPLSRTAFVLALAASCAAVLLLLASVATMAYAQVRGGGGGGGGASGLALFTGALPGTMQTGNANMSGTLCLGCSNSGTGVRLSASPGNGLVVQQSSITQAFDPAILTGGTGMANPVGLSVYQDAAIQLRGADGLPTTIKALSGTASVHLLGNPGASGTVPSVVVDTPQTTTAPLFDMRNFGASKFRVENTGALTAAVPIPQASGGTGAGATTCGAGQFLTSNGTSYSCAAAPQGTILGGDYVPTTSGTVAGSLCASESVPNSTFGLPAPTLTGVCTVNYVGTLATQNVTITCNVSSATTVELRWCNTGTNTMTIPTGTYRFRIIL